ncbi:BgTH12-07525 [Blumeria graminis f. sp. triticale]|uniref:BgTH12-07525 n=1 Tax=Blumeria graminis f. sp. triticale TaxID=1689686 RepID=A0A9W4GDD6_BLUGR|nr:BgTH12-07525 [Blumeria graminis f. sp. triticale]
MDIQSYTPIAQLTPQLAYLGQQWINTVIALVWPYCSATDTFSILLSEPDFRLRRAGGQVRVNFSGSSAHIIAKSGLSSGDKVTLCLDGVEWVLDPSEVNVPGTSIVFELKFCEKLYLHYQYDGDSSIHEIKLEKTHSNSNTNSSMQRQNLELIDPSTMKLPGESYSQPIINDKEIHSSPAFVRIAKISRSSIFDSDYDPFTEDDLTTTGNGRKRIRLNSVGSRSYSSIVLEAEKLSFQTPLREIEHKKNSQSPILDDNCHTDQVENVIKTRMLQSTRPEISIESNHNPIRDRELHLKRSIPKSQSPKTLQSLTPTDNYLVILSNSAPKLDTSGDLPNTSILLNTTETEIFNSTVTYNEKPFSEEPDIFTTNEIQVNESKTPKQQENDREDDNPGLKPQFLDQNMSNYPLSLASAVLQVGNQLIKDEDLTEFQKLNSAQTMPITSKLISASSSQDINLCEEKTEEMSHSLNTISDIQTSSNFTRDSSVIEQISSQDKTPGFKFTKKSSLEQKTRAFNDASSFISQSQVENASQGFKKNIERHLVNSSPDSADGKFSEIQALESDQDSKKVDKDYDELSSEVSDYDYKTEIEEREYCSEVLLPINLDQVDDCHSSDSYWGSDSERVFMYRDEDEDEDEDEEEEEIQRTPVVIDLLSSDEEDVVNHTHILESGEGRKILSEEPLNQFLEEVVSDDVPTRNKYLRAPYLPTQTDVRHDTYEEKDTLSLKYDDNSFEGFDNHSTASNEMHEESDEPAAINADLWSPDEDITKSETSSFVVSSNCPIEVKSLGIESCEAAQHLEIFSPEINDNAKNYTSSYRQFRQAGDLICSSEKCDNTYPLEQKDAIGTQLDLNLSTQNSPSAISLSPDLSLLSEGDLKLRLIRKLRNDLRDLTALKLIRYRQNQIIDILAVVTTSPLSPQRTRGGQKDYRLTFNVTDPTIAPCNVVQVQIFRSHHEALPIVGVGDAILLRNFQTFIEKKRVSLKSTNKEGSGSAVFKGAGEPEMRGTPIEFGDSEKGYVTQIRTWFAGLDGVAKAKIARANGNKLKISDG